MPLLKEEVYINTNKEARYPSSFGDSSTMGDGGYVLKKL